MCIEFLDRRAYVCFFVNNVFSKKKEIFFLRISYTCFNTITYTTFKVETIRCFRKTIVLPRTGRDVDLSPVPDWRVVL